MLPELTRQQRTRLTEMLAAELVAAHAAGLAAGADPQRLAAVVARRRRDVQEMVTRRLRPLWTDSLVPAHTIVEDDQHPSTDHPPQSPRRACHSDHR
jgi:hypothetical protein